MKQIFAMLVAIALTSGAIALEPAKPIQTEPMQDAFASPADGVAGTTISPVPKVTDNDKPSEEIKLPSESVTGIVTLPTEETMSIVDRLKTIPSKVTSFKHRLGTWLLNGAPETVDNPKI